MTNAAVVPLLPMHRPVFCGANRRGVGKGTTCRRPSGWGTDHVGWGSCKLHGGCVPSHGRSVATAQARYVAALFGVPRDDADPIEGLMEELQRTAGLVDAYEAMCVQLTPDEVVFGTISVEESRTVDEQGGEAGTDLAPREVKTRRAAALHVWVKLFNEERDRFARLCEAMVKLDLESRRVAMAQGQVAALVQILLSPELALSEDQRRAAARLMRDLDRAQDVIEGELVA